MLKYTRSFAFGLALFAGLGCHALPAPGQAAPAVSRYYSVKPCAHAEPQPEPNRTLEMMEDFLRSDEVKFVVRTLLVVSAQAVANKYVK